MLASGPIVPEVHGDASATRFHPVRADAARAAVAGPRHTGAGAGARPAAAPAQQPAASRHAAAPQRARDEPARRRRPAAADADPQPQAADPQPAAQRAAPILRGEFLVTGLTGASLDAVRALGFEVAPATAADTTLGLDFAVLHDT